LKRKDSSDIKNIKVQGVIEYLEQTGVTFPTEEEIAAETAEVALE
jgi:hypothetical protein